MNLIILLASKMNFNKKIINASIEKIKFKKIKIRLILKILKKIILRNSLA